VSELGARGRLRRAFGLGSAQALVRLLCSFVSIKLTAAYLGPSGLALIAQFNSLVTLVQGLVGAGANTAMVRLTAEYKGQDARQRALWASGARSVALLTLPVVLVLAVFAPAIAGRAFGDVAYRSAVWLCAFSVVVVVLNNLLLSVLNGLSDIQRVVRANVVATVAGLALFAPACVLGGVMGGFVGSALAYAAALAITLWSLRGQLTLQLKHLMGSNDAEEARRIWSFFPMLLAHAVLSPLSTMLVRDTIMRSVDVDAAGLWQASWRLSEVYLTIVTTSVSLYFMPRLGELAHRPAALRQEVWRTLGLVVAVTAGIAVVMGLLRHWVVAIVFSSSFAGAEALMPVQLAGDVLRMAAWTLGFVLVSQLRTRWYMAIEILVPATLVLTVGFFIAHFGVVGANWAYVASSALHLLLGFLGLRVVLFRQLES
jgi:polysaccharide transporter, PST family